MQLIAIDLDGTLLNEDSQISLENVQAIRRAIDHGVMVVIVTGRPFEAAMAPLKTVGLSLPIICLNGAKTYTIKEEVIKSIPISLVLSKKILTILQENNIYTELFTSNGTYSADKKDVINDIMIKANSSIEKNVALERANKRIQEEQIQFIESYNAILDSEHTDIYKIQGFSLNKELLSKVYNQLNIQDIIITSSGSISIEINHIDAQKGLALEMFARDMGIQMKNIMAIGDNLNDLSMLNVVGYSVAMGNAHDKVKEICHYTTKENSEDGVAFAIEKMLFNKV